MVTKVARGTGTGGDLVEFLQSKARQFGARPALLYKPGFRYTSWSYEDLWTGAGRVASLLQRNGLAKGDRVVLWGHNSPQWVLAFFGCLRAGVVLVPLDLRSAPDFVRKVVSRTSPKMAFVSRATPEWCQELGLARTRLEEVEELSEGLAPPEHVDVSSEALAEIMFTSGTTGDPKGVMLTHGNLLSNLESAGQFGLGVPTDRLLSILPLGHMFEQMGGLLIALRVGANVTYPTSRQPIVLFKTMSERRVTTLLLVPQALDLFMKGIEREVRLQGKQRVWDLSMKAARYMPFPLRRLLFKKVHQRFGGSLRLVYSGGAALDPELGAKWELLGVRINQAYGATEASPLISVHRADRPRYDSVGQPAPGVEVNIAEDGEVLVRGHNITPGYWEAPEQTAAALDDGWYKTGDQGYLDGKGFLHLKGRKKDMIVPASGENVYPEDIEAVLNKHPDVSEAVVVGLTSGVDSEVHAALLMEDPDAAAKAVSWANSQLAEHQQIRGSTVWPDEDFPRTHTLKVKKPLVLDYLLNRTKQEAETSPEIPAVAQSDLQRIVASVCSLPAEELTPEKSLGLDLNIDSLGRVELLSAIEQELGVYVDETKVVPVTTLAELATMIEAGDKEEVLPLPGWGRAMWCRLVRATLQYAFIFPMLRLFYSIKIVGREHLKELRGPVLFASNHNVMMDSPLTLLAIPAKWRWRLCPAAEANVVFGPRLKGMANVLLGNAFPFAREGSIRSSLEHLGQLLDSDWSILIYPEADKFLEQMEPFKTGTGLIAVQSGTPVVPIRVKLRKGSVFDRPRLFSRGSVEVHFGQPQHFPRNTDYLDATAQLEGAVKAL